MAKKIPAYTVTSKPRGRALISWRDEAANRRYHVWLNRFGELDEVIFSNWIDPKGKARPFKELNPSAKKWAPFIAHLSAELAAGRIADDRQAPSRTTHATREAAFQWFTRPPTAQPDLFTNPAA